VAEGESWRKKKIRVNSKESFDLKKKSRRKAKDGFGKKNRSYKQKKSVCSEKKFGGV